MFSELILEDVELKKGYNSKSLVLALKNIFAFSLRSLFSETFFPLTCPNNDLISRHTYLPLYPVTHAKKILGSL